MGLSVVHGIVQSHGGMIIAESNVGTGSTFTVFLPLSKAAVTAEEQVPNTIPKDPSGFCSSTMRRFRFRAQR